MARFDLSDAESRIIQSLLPNNPQGVPRADDRRVLNGIFYILRTSSPWRDLPERYGPYKTVYNRFNRWGKTGVWSNILNALSDQSPETMAFIDSSIIRAHQDAAGGKKGGQLKTPIPNEGLTIDCRSPDHFTDCDRIIPVDSCMTVLISRY